MWNKHIEINNDFIVFLLFVVQVYTNKNEQTFSHKIWFFFYINNFWLIKFNCEHEALSRKVLSKHITEQFYFQILTHKTKIPTIVVREGCVQKKKNIIGNNNLCRYIVFACMFMYENISHTLCNRINWNQH